MYEDSWPYTVRPGILPYGNIGRSVGRAHPRDFWLKRTESELGRWNLESEIIVHTVFINLTSSCDSVSKSKISPMRETSVSSSRTEVDRRALSVRAITGELTFKVWYSGCVSIGLELGGFLGREEGNGADGATSSSSGRAQWFTEHGKDVEFTFAVEDPSSCSLFNWLEAPSVA